MGDSVGWGEDGGQDKYADRSVPECTYEGMVGDEPNAGKEKGEYGKFKRHPKGEQRSGREGQILADL